MATACPIRAKRNPWSQPVRTGQGNYTVTFVAGTFTVIPIVTVTAFDVNKSNNRFAVLDSVTTTEVHVLIRDTAGTSTDAAFNFIAIGER